MVDFVTIEGLIESDQKACMTERKLEYLTSIRTPVLYMECYLASLKKSSELTHTELTMPPRWRSCPEITMLRHLLSNHYYLWSIPWGSWICPPGKALGPGTLVLNMGVVQVPASTCGLTFGAAMILRQWLALTWAGLVTLLHAFWV